MINEIQQCRICANRDLVSVIDLGEQALTGVFPRKGDAPVAVSRLELVKCTDHDPSHCGLLQLRHFCEAGQLYGDHYGYRSSLNQSMVNHLKEIVGRLSAKVSLREGDIVLDIGSNDSTLLQAYVHEGIRLIGIDPTAHKFRKYYPDHIELIDDFFSASTIRKEIGREKTMLITSIAMFYDLEAPLDFMKQIYEILADDGLWAFEQSYMPAMLRACAYDTICHEHFEYYRLKQIHWMTERAGFKIIDIDFNDTNGGSFLVIVAKKDNPKVEEATDLINKVITQEEEDGLCGLGPYQAFQEQITAHRGELLHFFEEVKKKGETVFGYGASTKGNVILQYCGFKEGDIPCVAEVNEDKFGCVTPGSGIPIVSEADAKKNAPDYFLVLPWHFRNNIVKREKEFLENGGKLVFPLPRIEVVSQSALCGEVKT